MNLKREKNKRVLKKRGGGGVLLFWGNFLISRPSFLARFCFAPPPKPVDIFLGDGAPQNKKKKKKKTPGFRRIPGGGFFF